MPAVVDWHATVAVCGEAPNVTLVGDIAPHVRPAGTVSVSETVPVNPLTAVTVMVDVADVFTFTAAGDVAAMVKSVMVKEMDAEWLNDPLDAVKLTM